MKTPFDENMGYVYLAEQTTPDHNMIKNIDVNNVGNVFYVTFDTVLHTFEEINRNQRMYLADNVRECLMTEKIQSLLADNAWYGEMDHPTPMYKDKPLSPERLQQIYMPNRSHKILKPKIVGDALQARIETSSGSEPGVGFGKEIIQGLHPAFSCRAIAVVKMMNGKPTVIIRRLLTYDWVLYPSHKRAHSIGGAKPVIKKFNMMTESVDEQANRPITTSDDVMIPLTEILESVGKTDVNTQMILESFDLPLESLCGFDATRQHIMVRDKDNMFYANISPETKHKVDDFFGSFNL